MKKPIYNRGDRPQGGRIKAKKLAIWMALASIPAMANAADAEIKTAAEELPEVSVKAEKEVRFKTERSSAATKFDAELRDVPQTVNVISEAQLKSQKSFNLRDALKNVSGISIAAGEGGRTGDAITLRGFSANSDMYIDGMKDNGQYNRDTFYIEKVEVLKGASGMMFGRGATGGLINQVSKKADGERHMEGSVSYGSFDNKRATIDVGTAINEVVSVRLNALVQDSDSYRDENFVKRKGLSPSISFKFNEDTNLTLNYLYQKEEGVYDYGIPIVNGKKLDVKDSTFFGHKDDLLQDYDVNIATAIFSHAFSDEFSIKNSTRYADTKRKYRTFLPRTIDPVALTSTYRQRLRQANLKSLFNQTDFLLKTPIAGMPNTLSLGLEFGSEEYTYKTKDSLNGGSADSPVYSLLSPLPDTWVGTRASDLSGALGTDRKVKAKTQAFYIQDQLEITEQWKLIAGTRYDRYATNPNDKLNPARNAFSDTIKEWSNKFGAVWQPNDEQSYYVSYGESFNPYSENFSVPSTQNRADLEPETSKNIEVGGKWELMDGKLSLTSAIYRLEKDNQRDRNAAGDEFNTGKQRTDGFEVSLSGEIAENWSVSAGYAYQDAELVDASRVRTGPVSGLPVAYEGNRPSSVAKHSGSVWTTYGFLPNWEIGGGVIAQGQRFAESTNEINIPGYVRLDAVLAYHQPKYDVQLNIYNLLDKEYIESSRTNIALPGIPVSGLLSLNVRF